MFRLALYTAVLIGTIQVLGQDLVDVGTPDGTFDPQFINLEQGSLLTMRFWDRRTYSFRESTFEEPCTWGGSFFSLNVTAGSRSMLEFDTFALDVWSGLGSSKANHSLWFYNAADNRCKEVGAIFAINPPSEAAFNDASARAQSGDILFGDELVTSFYPLTTAPVASSASEASTPSATGSASGSGSAKASVTPSTTSSGSPSNSTGGSNDNDDAAVSLTVGKAIIAATVMGIVGLGVMF